MAEQLSRYKINQLQLYIEHTFVFRAHPDIGRDDSALSAEDILQLDEYCRARHIELVPSFASFGHMTNVLRHPQYHHLAEDWGAGKFIDPDAPLDWHLQAWTLAVANPESYQFLDSLFAEFLPLFSSPRFNACCDETYDLGWGQSYELCRERGKGRVYLDHILKLREMAARYGKELMIWGDVLRHYPELISEVPPDITILDWAYDATHDFGAIADFRPVIRAVYVCPGTSSWAALFPRLHEAKANIAGFAAAGKRHGVRGLLNTDWGDGGHSNFMEHSWPGFLFGAEQSWNANAETACFDARFCARFVGISELPLADALASLGDISGVSCEGYGDSIWPHFLFALPAEKIFGEPLCVTSTLAHDGSVMRRRHPLDAAYFRALLEKLENIRAVFADCIDRAKCDAAGVLRYWLFAADATALAVRKATAFGVGAQPTSDEADSIRAALQELRARFEVLWLERNRPSEMEWTLARFDRAIRGDYVRTVLRETEPGRIRVEVENAGDTTVPGQVSLSTAPTTAARFDSPAVLEWTALAPGQTRSGEFALVREANARKIFVTATAQGPGVEGAKLALFGDQNWGISTIRHDSVYSGNALENALVALADFPARTITLPGQPVAVVRCALWGLHLVIEVQVWDDDVRRANPIWRGSCVEVFGSDGTGGIGQVFLAPPCDGLDAAAFHLKESIVAAREIVLETVAQDENGYTLGALVPLSLLKIADDATQFRLEVVVTARLKGRREHQRASLFFAENDAGWNDAGFGRIQIINEFALGGLCHQ